MRAGVGGVVVAALLAGACVTSEISPIGARRPARAEGCAVDIFPSTTPPYPFAEVASASASCHNRSGRNACIEELRKEACAWGADTIFGFQDGRFAEGMTIAATFAVRTEATPPAGVKTKRPAAAEDDGCNPICSPGFACKAGQCMPQCNPPCEAGEACSRKRVCEPADGKLEPAKASGTSQ